MGRRCPGPFNRGDRERLSLAAADQFDRQRVFLGLFSRGKQVGVLGQRRSAGREQHVVLLHARLLGGTLWQDRMHQNAFRSLAQSQLARSGGGAGTVRTPIQNFPSGKYWIGPPIKTRIPSKPGVAVGPPALWTVTNASRPGCCPLSPAAGSRLAQHTAGQRAKQSNHFPHGRFSSASGKFRQAGPPSRVQHAADGAIPISCPHVVTTSAGRQSESSPRPPAPPAGVHRASARGTKSVAAGPVGRWRSAPEHGGRHGGGKVADPRLGDPVPFDRR